MGIIQLLRYFIHFLRLLIIIRIVLSWIPGIDPYTPPVRFLHDVTEPMIKPVREFMIRYVNTGPLDLSLLIVFLLLRAVDIYLVRLL